jgi:hypothetical protein
VATNISEQTGFSLHLLKQTELVCVRYCFLLIILNFCFKKTFYSKLDFHTIFSREKEK